MSSTNPLSPSALDLLRRRAAGESIEVTEENKPIYRELTDAGIMAPMHTFRDGRESVYKFTEVGWRIATAPWLSEGVSLPH